MANYAALQKQAAKKMVSGAGGAGRSGGWEYGWALQGDLTGLETVTPTAAHVNAGSHTTGTYANVNITGGTGTGAKCTVTVAGDGSATIAVTTAGSGFLAGDTGLTIVAADTTGIDEDIVMTGHGLSVNSTLILDGAVDAANQGVSIGTAAADATTESWRWKMPKMSGAPVPLEAVLIADGSRFSVIMDAGDGTADAAGDNMSLVPQATTAAYTAAADKAAVVHVTRVDTNKVYIQVGPNVLVAASVVLPNTGIGAVATGAMGAAGVTHVKGSNLWTVALINGGARTAEWWV